jgi:hypothetical protein
LLLFVALNYAGQAFVVGKIASGTLDHQVFFA